MFDFDVLEEQFEHRDEARKAEKLKEASRSVAQEVKSLPAKAVPETTRGYDPPRFAPIQRKIRVLALHGGGSNANIMKYQVMPLRRALGDQAEWEFLNGGRSWKFNEGQKPPEIMQALAAGMPFYGWYAVEHTDQSDRPYQEKLFDPSVEFTYSQVDVGIDRVLHQIKENGPVDILVGFSQGCIVSHLVAAILRQRGEAGAFETMERVGRIVRHINAGLSPQPTSSDSPVMADLKAKIAKLAKEKTALKADLLKNHGDRKIQDLTVEMAINGARAVKCMVTETSDLDANTGISYRHLSLYEVNKELPKAQGGKCALPEGAFWLLLTGEVPTALEVQGLTEELHKRATIPPNVMATIDALPIETHPMTQLSVGMLALQKDSKFAQKYNDGMKKDEYWQYALEDALDLIAKIPIVAAKIYRRTFKDGVVPEYNPKLDWAANFAQMLGINSDEGFNECTRLYLMLHADHEGGNVSAHTTHLVGSALSDPYYAWAAGLCGLAGPLHGLANQECLGWLLDVQKQLGGQKPTKELLTEFANKTLKEGKVIPGFGHAVLRNTDPRYMLEREFALEHCQEDPLFQLVDACYQAIPKVLEKQGKVKNPFPNVDAHSGQLMHFYNLKEQNFYTVVFAVSRTLGVMAQYVWSRAIGLPIERPKSVPLDELDRLQKKHWFQKKGTQESSDQQ